MQTDSKPTVAVVDYQLANMFSVERACAHVGLSPVLTADAATIESAAAVILPGVGAFGEAMAHLVRLDLVAPLRAFADSGRPFLGICLGMQLLLTESEEFEVNRGLDLVPGRVVRFPASSHGQRIRIPQIGWNRVTKPEGVSWKGTPLETTAEGEYMYFLHSYYAVPDSSDAALCQSNYEGIEYCSGVVRDNVFGLQFHPEKSAEKGIRIYECFANLISAADNKKS